MTTGDKATKMLTKNTHTLGSVMSSYSSQNFSKVSFSFLLENSYMCKTLTISKVDLRVYRIQSRYMLTNLSDAANNADDKHDKHDNADRYDKHAPV
jgi:hypothetical protein